MITDPFLLLGSVVACHCLRHWVDGLWVQQSCIVFFCINTIQLHQLVSRAFWPNQFPLMAWDSSERSIGLVIRKTLDKSTPSIFHMHCQSRQCSFLMLHRPRPLSIVSFKLVCPDQALSRAGSGSPYQDPNDRFSIRNIAQNVVLDGDVLVATAITISSY